MLPFDIEDTSVAASLLLFNYRYSHFIVHNRDLHTQLHILHYHLLICSNTHLWHPCLHAYVHTSTYHCTYLCTYPCIHHCTHPCTHPFIHTYAHTCTNTCLYIYLQHRCIHVRMTLHDWHLWDNNKTCFLLMELRIEIILQMGPQHITLKNKIVSV